MKDADGIAFFTEALEILENDILNSKEKEPLPFNAAFHAVEQSIKSVRNLSIQNSSKEDLCQMISVLRKKIPSGGENKENLLSLLRAFLLAAPRTDQGHFYAERYGKVEFSSMVMAMFSELMNISLYTFEISNIYTLMEMAFQGYLFETLRWRSGDYIFTPGSTCANYYAINLASFCKNEAVKAQGIKAIEKAVIYCSRLGYSETCRMAKFSGHGTNCVKIVKSDNQGHLVPSSLAEEMDKDVKRGFLPLMAYTHFCPSEMDLCDPIDEIKAICKPRNVWVHVNASAGGGLLFFKDPPELNKNCSLKHPLDMSMFFNKMIQGVSRVDSITWSFHESLDVPLNCTIFAVREKEGVLQRAYSTGAVYLFQKDKYYDKSYDTGDKSIQCSRKMDILKLWSSWLALGTDGLTLNLTKKLAFTTFLLKEMKKHDNLFTIVPVVSLTVILFTLKAEVDESLNTVTVTQVQNRLLQRGKLILKVIHHPFSKAIGKNPDICFRLCVNCALPSIEAMNSEFDFICSELKSCLMKSSSTVKRSSSRKRTHTENDE